MKKKRIYNFDFFDGQVYLANCLLNENYWLSSSNEYEYVKAKVSVAFENLEYIFFPFDPIDSLSRLSFQDFSKLNNEFFLSGVSYIPNNNYPLNLTTGNSLEMMSKKVNEKTIYIIYSVGGGRAPESIVVLEIFEIITDSISR